MAFALQQLRYLLSKLVVHWERLGRVVGAGNHLSHTVLEFNDFLLLHFVFLLELVPLFAHSHELVRHQSQLLTQVADFVTGVYFACR